MMIHYIYRDLKHRVTEGLMKYLPVTNKNKVKFPTQHVFNLQINKTKYFRLRLSDEVGTERLMKYLPVTNKNKVRFPTQHVFKSDYSPTYK